MIEASKSRNNSEPPRRHYRAPVEGWMSMYLVSTLLGGMRAYTYEICVAPAVLICLSSSGSALYLGGTYSRSLRVSISIKFQNGQSRVKNPIYIY